MKAKGRRYSQEEKDRILAFVEDYNAKHNRGGQTAAAEEFGLSPITLRSWIQERHEASDCPPRAVIYRKLAKIEEEIGKNRRQIETFEKRVAELHAEQERLKAQVLS